MGTVDAYHFYRDKPTDHALFYKFFLHYKTLTVNIKRMFATSINVALNCLEVTPNEGTIGPTRTVIIDEDEEDNQENGNGEDVDESDSPTKSTPRKSRVVDSDDEDREEDISKKYIFKETSNSTLITYFRSKQIFGSDSDDDSDKGDDEKKKTKMLANIFGDDISDEEKEPEDKEKV